MKINVRALTRNPKLLIGVAAAAGLGLFVLVRRGRTGSGSASESATVPTSTAGAPGTYDSTSSDIANQLGQYQTGLQTALAQANAAQQAALDEYGNQLNTTLNGLTSGTAVSGTPAASSAHQQHVAHLAHLQTLHEQHVAHLAHVANSRS